ncbi:MAG: hypothetical protein WBA34_06545, partial [Candidatus Deferrimicrobiaceae bacterium]
MTQVLSVYGEKGRSGKTPLFAAILLLLMAGGQSIAGAADRVSAERSGGSSPSPAYPGCDKVKNDDAALFRCLKDASEGGDPLAQQRLGDLYEAGRGVLRDPAESMKWYRK